MYISGTYTNEAYINDARVNEADINEIPINKSDINETQTKKSLTFERGNKWRFYKWFTNNQFSANISLCRLGMAKFYPEIIGTSNSDHHLNQDNFTSVPSHSIPVRKEQKMFVYFIFYTAEQFIIVKCVFSSVPKANISEELLWNIIGMEERDANPSLQLSTAQCNIPGNN